MVSMNSYESADKRKKLSVSFEYVAKWMQTANMKKFDIEEDQIEQSLQTLSHLSSRSNPEEVIRRQPELVRAIDSLESLQSSFKSMPENDPDRNNQQLRTALRRISELRNKDIWHVQLT